MNSNIMVTSIGRRVQLIKHLKREFYVVGVDCSSMNAGKHFVNSFYEISKFDEDSYIDELIEICKAEKISLIIPLYELEFNKLLEYKQLFDDIGVTILLSDKEIIEISNNKELAYKFAIKHGIVTPKTFIKGESINKDFYPLIIKPKAGMGSKSVFKISNEYELKFFESYIENSIVQQFIEGDEFTVDVLCDLVGQPVYIIPRVRLEVRAGEVSKSRIIKDKKIISITKAIIEQFNEIGSGLRGPLTFQFIKTSEDEIYFLELNPRFGGGVPLSLEAGAEYGISLKKMINGEMVNYREDFKELTMLRYDDAIFY